MTPLAQNATTHESVAGCVPSVAVIGLAKGRWLRGVHRCADSRFSFPNHRARLHLGRENVGPMDRMDEVSLGVAPECDTRSTSPNFRRHHIPLLCLRALAVNRFPLLSAHVWAAVFLFAIGRVPSAVAVTNVSGTISQNTIWNVAGGPYVVTGSVTVTRPSRSTIASDVIVKFGAGTSLTVDGQLLAAGTASRPISCTSIKDDTVGTRHGTGASRRRPRGIGGSF